MRYYGLNEEDVSKFRSKPVMKNLFESLNKNENFISYKVAEALGEFEDKKTVDTLIDALEDDDESVREMVINTLGRIGDRNSVTPIITHIGDDDELKELLISVLGEIGGEKSLEFIGLALNEDNLEVKLKAIEALGKISHPKSIEELIYTLMDDNLEVKLCALASLGEIGDPKALKPLTKFLTNRKWIIRKYALNALGKIAECPIEIFIKALKDKDYRVREKAVEILGIRGDEKSIDHLKPMINDPNEDVKTRVREILKLHDKYDPTMELGDNTGKSANLNRFIQEIGKDKVVEILKEYFEMEDMMSGEEVDLPAETSPQNGEREKMNGEEVDLPVETSPRSGERDRMNGEEVDLPVETSPQNGERDKMNGEEVKLPAETSSKKNGETGVKFINKDVADKISEDVEIEVDPVLRDLCDEISSKLFSDRKTESSEEELGEVPVEDEVESALSDLRSDKYKVWWWAKEDLKEMGDVAVEPLINLLEDENQTVRGRVVLVLCEIGNEQAIAPLIKHLEFENTHIRKKIALSMYKFGKSAIEPLTEALKHEDFEIRESAAEALGEIGDASALDALEDALNDENVYVRNRVKAAIRRTKALKGL